MLLPVAVDLAFRLAGNAVVRNFDDLASITLEASIDNLVCTVRKVSVPPILMTQSVRRSG
jgi:hypothetical protein